jgi:7-carboxy-7-deazaguanine synthase
MLAEEVVDRKLDVRVLPQLHKIIWGDRKGV